MRSYRRLAREGLSSELSRQPTAVFRARHGVNYEDFASRPSASCAGRRAAAMPVEVVDSGPWESVLAKKMRSIGWRASR
jgi:hypothetical protein